MESLSGIDFFVRAAETRSFSEAGRALGISSSAVGKSVARLEERLGVRLFHRSTRSITLTAEGALFLERCRRILSEVEAAELELSETRKAPRGKLRVSVPLVADLVMPTLIAFMRRYPSIELDLDFSDRLVDIIEEGFDVVIRTGEPNDSRLMSRPLGPFKLVVVGSPRYFAEHGTPQVPTDLLQHACLLYKFPSTGRLQVWPVRQEGEAELNLPATLLCNTTEALLHVVRDALGIACVPDFTVREALAAGELVTVLDDFNQHQSTFRMLWPSSKHLAPKLRVFIDFMNAELFKR
ncbi:LysR family transcriptional regulator [Pseudomonas brassicacearum]|uniref:DNA-binding transcriptional LysR family regulator n=1 Tax=Pseudomonas brassicacearum TaxID=930166 RepID=A0AAW8M896_9PSED|nr:MULTISPECIES: LysR family transcriptional regulator [Pseudomonas]MDR6958015.1 DNA-binding transcriptional LysR family regulator [Pseudomonas brassicacearum]ROM83192.1 LysR family transcriptional regulator [Pseudomonas brassicacearum]UZE15740.1 LysR family transcriptional regulator [Pseudomonas sp. B21-054]